MPNKTEVDKTKLDIPQKLSGINFAQLGVPIKSTIDILFAIIDINSASATDFVIIVFDFLVFAYFFAQKIPTIDKIIKIVK